MTEDDARAWVRRRFGVPCETLLERFAELVVDENARQNLISPSTVPTIWYRHIVDAAQLIALDRSEGESLWVDIGTGAGFPGLVTGLLSGRPTLLVEPRRKRAEFLASAIATLDLPNIRVAQSRVETLAASEVATTISARAVASLSSLFLLAGAISRRKTCWILPKGQSAQSEVDAACEAWHGVFHVEQSITHPDAAIVVATGICPK